MALDTYIMLSDERADKPSREETESLYRLVSFSGNADDMDVAWNLATRRNMMGIAAMFEIVKEGREI